MKVRMAENQDIPKIHQLLSQVCLVHHKGRPDLFKYGARKYTDEELMDILQDPKKPVFVAVDEDGQVAGYALSYK